MGLSSGLRLAGSDCVDSCHAARQHRVYYRPSVKCTIQATRGHDRDDSLVILDNMVTFSNFHVHLGSRAFATLTSMKLVRGVHWSACSPEFRLLL